MPTPFSSPNTWQHGTFTFTSHSGLTAIDDRGNTSSPGITTAITFKMRPTSPGMLQKGEAADTGNPVYECRIVAIAGDTERYLLSQSDIRLGDIGEGQLNGRDVRVIVKDIGQSSVSPITEPVLGSSIKLEVNYRVRRGSVAAV